MNRLKFLTILLLSVISSFAQDYDTNTMYPIKKIELCEIKGFPYFNEIEDTILTYLKDNNYGKATVSLDVDKFMDYDNSQDFVYDRDKFFPIEVYDPDQAYLVQAILMPGLTWDCPWYYKRGKTTFKVSENFKPWVVRLKKIAKIMEIVRFDGMEAVWYFLIADGKLYTVRVDLEY